MNDIRTDNALLFILTTSAYGKFGTVLGMFVYTCIMHAFFELVLVLI